MMEVDWNESELKITYEKMLKSFENEHKGAARKIWTNAKIEEVINVIKKTKIAKTTGAKLNSMEYYWSGKYEYNEVNGKEFLTFKKKSPEQPTIRIIPREEFFDFLKPIHINCGHGGRDKMSNGIKNKFYVPKKAIEIFIVLCPVCGPKKNTSIDRRQSQEKHPHSHCIIDFNNRGIFNIIDFQSCPDGEFKWLLKYQDYATKFYNFRPLKTKEPKEIAIQLLQIFLTFGPPASLQSYTNAASLDTILKEIKTIWPDCKTINAFNSCERIKPETLRRHNAVIGMLRSWVSEKNNWSLECFFFQYHINTSTTAYKNLFCRVQKYSLSKAVESSTPLLTEKDIDSDDLRRKTIPETESKHSVTTPESCSSTALNDDQYPFSIKVEHQEIKEEIHNKFDDLKILLEPHDYNTEENSTNLDIQSTDCEREHFEQPGMVDKHNKRIYNVAAEYPNLNTLCDDERDEYFDSISRIQMINVKTEPHGDQSSTLERCNIKVPESCSSRTLNDDNFSRIQIINVKTEPHGDHSRTLDSSDIIVPESCSLTTLNDESISRMQMIKVKTESIEESDQPKITCSVCRHLTYVEHTIICDNCKTFIHKTCAVTDEMCDTKAFCNSCFSKLDPKFKNKQKKSVKRMKRPAEVIAKRILLSAASSNVYEKSRDVDPNLDFIGPD